MTLLVGSSLIHKAAEHLLGASSTTLVSMPSRGVDQHARRSIRTDQAGEGSIAYLAREAVRPGDLSDERKAAKAVIDEFNQ